MASHPDIWHCVLFGMDLERGEGVDLYSTREENTVQFPAHGDIRYYYDGLYNGKHNKLRSGYWDSWRKFRYSFQVCSIRSCHFYGVYQWIPVQVDSLSE